MATQLTLNVNTKTIAKPVLTLAKPGPAKTLDTLPMAPPTLKAPTAESYKQYDHRTHVYMKPDTYIGADETVTREEWLMDIENSKAVAATIDFVPGCERIFLEVLSNASDNVGRSRRANVDPGTIEVVMDNKTVCIKNYGLPIPVEMHPKEHIYVPQMIFGSLLTSSNYEVDRHEAGTNGIGAKACNIFSSKFMVVVEDSIRHLKYSQIWENNMIVCHEPVIEAYTGKASSVAVIYEMDFARFKYPVPNGASGGYPPEAFALFARHAVDISFTAKVKCSFNGKVFNYSNIRDYSRLYYGDAVDNAIVHYQWPPGTDVVTKRKGHQVAKDVSVNPTVELLALDTPDAGSSVSFVNCMMTRDGGVHVNAAVKAVGDTAVKIINEMSLKRLAKGRKGKEIDAKDKRANTITIADVRPHMSIVLSVKVLNPKFTSQTKTNLHSPIPKIDVSDESLKAMGKWDLLDRLFAALEAKQYMNLSKTDGKLRAFVKLEKGIDANHSRTARRSECILCITEGRSGAGYANKFVSMYPGGRDFVGVLPLRGKGLNVMNATIDQIAGNREIGELKKMLGMAENIDYTQPENRNKLRYGRIYIMTDSDNDGKHITGLILNFFHCRNPTILALGMIYVYRTPIIRVFQGQATATAATLKGVNVKKFYTLGDYAQWRAVTPDYQRWRHKYYKGLGSSNDAEIADDYALQRIVLCYYDVNAPSAIKLAFDKDLANRRKDWLQSWAPQPGTDNLEIQPISVFINHEFIHFSFEDIARSIPAFMDGFKEAPRKIIHAAHKKWKISSKKPYQEFKVARFGAFVAEQTNYSHGELNLDKVITGMAQDFVGSNNIPWFTRDGQYGTRYSGGKDASETRYTTTTPELIVKYIFRKEDLPILTYRIDEGEAVEPERYYPIIPVVLLNGARGIGTGWNTTILQHNILDIILWFKMRLQNASDDDLPRVDPWFRGYTGIIKVIDRRRKRNKKVTVATLDCNGGIVTPQAHVTEEADIKVDLIAEALDETEANEIDEEQEEYGSRPLLSMMSLGRFEVNRNGTIIITELPIGRWPIDYRRWLESLQENKEITGFVDRSVVNSVYFEITGFKGDVNYITLKLRRTIGMSNMVLLDNDDKPIRYDTVYDILDSFFVQRLPLYQKRKEYMITQITAQIAELREKMRFIDAVVVSKQLTVADRPRAEIYERMDAMGFHRDLYKKTGISKLSKDSIAKLQNEIAAHETELTTLIATPNEAIWMRELDELETNYRKLFGYQKTTLNVANPQTQTQTRMPAVATTLKLAVK